MTLLDAFSEAGVLGFADVHVARRVGQLGGEPSEVVQLAIALAVRALRHGSVCIDLSDISCSIAVEDLDVGALPWPSPSSWLDACAHSPVVGAGRPLQLVGGLLYLDRYWRDEELIRRQLHDRAHAPLLPADLTQLRADLDRFFEPDAERQRLAAAVSALRRVTVLAGGPGTGKTTTIARLLDVLRAQPGPQPRIALAAPTGKAAARLSESVGLPAFTLHRLLGRRPGSRTRFLHHRSNRLPYDVIVVDETSMVSLTLMARLLEAVRPDARLILVGDPDQLASVEAGAVLGDIVAAAGRPEPALTVALAAAGVPADVVNGVVTLNRTWRFGGDLARLATAVRSGDADDAVHVLLSGDDQVRLVDPSDHAALRETVIATDAAVTAFASAGDAGAALAGLGDHRLLCAHRRGPYGVTGWTARVESWLPSPPTELAPGRPLLITANDYEAGLYNGDTGVIVRTPDGPRAAFARGGEIALIPSSRLSQAQPLHAMTVHRSQGSQFTAVTLILPPATSPLLTRELFYTAVTRATTSLRVIGTSEAVRVAVGRPITRASGLRSLRPTADPRPAVYPEPLLSEPRMPG